MGDIAVKMLDLFSGIGGFSLAARWTGKIETVAFCEIDPFCRKVLAKHWPEVPCFDDIRTLTADTLRERGIDGVDMLTGGFPCQPFSIAGKRNGKADDGYLWPEMLRIITDVRPAWIVAENVLGLIQLALDSVLSELESAGYSCGTLVLPACGVGAWHKRERVWIVAYGDGTGRGEQWRPGTNETKQPAIKRLRRCEFCGYKFDEECGRYGCPNCEGDGLDADADSKRRRTKSPFPGSNGQRTRHQFSWCDWWETQSRFRGVPDGLSSGMVRNRVAQLKAYGNAIVPQCVYPILQAIADMETGK